MIIDYRFGALSGISAEEFYVLGYRFEEGFEKTEFMESFVVQMVPDATRVMAGLETRYRGIWVSDTHRVFVADARGRMNYNANPNLDPDGWSSRDLGTAMRGVWGLDDDYVLAWGAVGDQERMFRWNGADWDEMPAPPGTVWGVHGISRDLVFAVGDSGLIARWDGTSWHRMPHEATNLKSVHVVSANEIYICGSSGTVLEGSIHGFSELLIADTQFHSIAKFKDDLWVGSWEDGLFKVQGNKAVLVKPNLAAHTLESRRNILFIGCDEMAAYTHDGAKFRGFNLRSYAQSQKGRPPGWAPDIDMSMVADLADSK